MIFERKGKETNDLENNLSEMMREVEKRDEEIRRFKLLGQSKQNSSNDLNEEIKLLYGAKEKDRQEVVRLKRRIKDLTEKNYELNRKLTFKVVESTQMQSQYEQQLLK
jgi:CRISPR/Cas system CSM-associated protein Csm2 small subunit